MDQTKSYFFCSFIITNKLGVTHEACHWSNDGLYLNMQLLANEVLKDFPESKFTLLYYQEIHEDEFKSIERGHKTIAVLNKLMDEPSEQATV